MVTGLMQANIQQDSILDIGCGTGYLHQSLLLSGAKYSIGVDLSENMLNEAKKLANEQQLENRTEYLLGHYLDLAENIPSSDVTILDKVICCDPDAESLIKTAAIKSKKYIALTYPRTHLLNRLGVFIIAIVMKIFRIEFRNYLYQPEAVEAWLISAGFKKNFENRTHIWLTQLYVRQNQ